LARILVLPTHFSRNITIVFASHRSFLIEDGRHASGAAAMFVPPDVPFTECSVEMEGTVSSIRLFHEGCSVVLLRFDVSELSVHIPRLVSFLMKVLSLPFLGGHSFTSTDAFLFHVWGGLASNLREYLGTVSFVSLSFDSRSPAPHFLQSLLASLTNVRTVSTGCANLWDNPCLIPAIGHRTFPKLQKLILALDETMTASAVDAINQFLKDRAGVECVLFRVSPLQVHEKGYAAFDNIGNMIGSMMRDIPDSISLDWFKC
jgi:hypothetical protein